MPCRREEDEEDEAAAAGEEEEEDAEGEEEESFLLLQQSVTVGGSGEVDRLVAQIGEALQLDAAHGRRPAPRWPLTRKQQPQQPPPPPVVQPPVLLLLPPEPAPAPLQPSGPLQCTGSGARAALSWPSDVGAASYPPPLAPSGPCYPEGGPAGSSASGPHLCKRSFPQALPGPCRRAWLRGAAASRRLRHHHRQDRYRGQPGLRAGDDDPHQLLQQLVLSGNLIKEAVRRLHSRRPGQHFRSRASFPPVRPRPPPLPLAVQDSETEGSVAHCSPRRPFCSNPEGLRRQLAHKLADGILVPSS